MRERKAERYLSLEELFKSNIKVCVRKSDNTAYYMIPRDDTMATPEGLTDPVSFMEEASMLEKVDRLAKFRGSNRSVIYREAIRYFLANLSDQEKKTLGITPTQ